MIVLLACLAVAALALAPGAFAAGFGRALADLWISTMSVVMGLLGALLGR